jgi:N,N'-diacetyllegionaminate synthase
MAHLSSSATLASVGIAPSGACFVIAEAGVNHNGDLAQAQALVRAAKASGADCVKFQTFTAERVAVRSATKAAYQQRVTDPRESQVAMLRGLELSAAYHRVLAEQCADEGIRFLSTPYDLHDAELLATLGVPAFKLASIHLVELPLLRELAAFGIPLILSTGMATLAEVDTAVRTLRECGDTEFCVLQCTTNYPSRPADANLRAMTTMGQALGVPVGYSDHTEGIAISLAAVALGARVIEKHFTLDRTLPGPDHACSSDPAEFSALVRGLRDVEAALGNGIKAPTAAERENLPGMRRSVVATQPLVAGTVLRREHVAFKRPGTGFPPARLPELLGRTLTVDRDVDDPLELRDVA